jgi:hypothetical protein
MEIFGQMGAMAAVMVAALFVWQIIEDNLMGEDW